MRKKRARGVRILECIFVGSGEVYIVSKMTDSSRDNGNENHRIEV